jgi:hypothetical protein
MFCALFCFKSGPNTSLKPQFLLNCSHQANEKYFLVTYSHIKICFVITMSLKITDDSEKEPRQYSTPIRLLFPYDIYMKIE